MAKQEVLGFDGAGTLPTGCGFDVTGWAATLDIEKIKVPAAFGSKWNKTAAGCGEITGSFEGNLVWNASGTKPLDLSGSDWSAFAASLTLTATTGCTITGAFQLFNVTIDRKNGQLGTIKADFANTGTDPACTWDIT